MFRNLVQAFPSRIFWIPKLFKFLWFYKKK